MFIFDHIFTNWREESLQSSPCYLQETTTKSLEWHLTTNTEDTGVHLEAVLLHLFLSLSLAQHSKPSKVQQDSFHSAPPTTTTLPSAAATSSASSIGVLPRSTVSMMPGLLWAQSLLSNTSIIKHELKSTGNAPQLTHKPLQSIIWPSRARNGYQ